jgi:hypothetical protein
MKTAPKVQKSQILCSSSPVLSALSGSCTSPSLSSEAGGGHLSYWQAGGGNLYIYKVLRALEADFCMVEGSVNTFSWLKRPHALPSAVFHHPLWDYSIIFTLRPGTLPWHWTEGVAFIAALSYDLTLWRRNLQCCVCLIRSSEDELWLWPWLSLVPGGTCHAPGRGHLPPPCLSLLDLQLLAWRLSSSSSTFVEGVLIAIKYTVVKVGRYSVIYAVV